MYTVKKHHRPSQSAQDRGGPVLAASATCIDVLDTANEAPTTLLVTSVAPFPFLSNVDRALLTYYLHAASSASSCHSLVQQDLCKLIVPMAMDSPALLYATLALSAIHWKSLGASIVTDMSTDGLITSLKFKSLRHLQQDLQCPTANSRSAVVATVRSHYLCEVYTGADRPRTWRAHFEGAKALTMQANYPSGSKDFNATPEDRFLGRWFEVTQALVALTKNGLPRPPEDSSTWQILQSTERELVYLDEYTGYSIDLNPVFLEIGHLLWDLQHTDSSSPLDTRFDKGRLAASVLHLQDIVTQMIERDRSFEPMFRPAVSKLLSPQQITEYRLCNEAYQLTALVHIQRRLLKFLTTWSGVQTSIKRILECVCSISPALPNPLAVLTTPVFTAGCEAFGGDRNTVRQLLRRMYNSLRIPNMQRALEILEAYWISDECKQGDGWEAFIGESAQILWLL